MGRTSETRWQTRTTMTTRRRLRMTMTKQSSHLQRQQTRICAGTRWLLERDRHDILQGSGSFVGRAWPWCYCRNLYRPLCGRVGDLQRYTFQDVLVNLFFLFLTLFIWGSLPLAHFTFFR